MNTDQRRYEMGQRIRSFRIANNLTQAQFAESLDVSTNYVSEIENGKKGISQETLFKLCDIYHLSADFLLFGKGNDSTLGECTLFELLSSIPTDTIPIVIEYLQAALKIRRLEEKD